MILLFPQEFHYHKFLFCSILKDQNGQARESKKEGF
tara:strand:+ start:315 stop:422 length:108 start_codon:yes stop_codon:yes gene_type:complete